MRNTLSILLLLLSFSCVSQEEKGIYIIDVQSVKTDIIGKDVQLVDVRSEEEYNKGHIDDAININIADKERFTAEIQKLDKTKPVYIYCHSGVRSHRASKLIQELGFTTIYDFTGGWSVWSQN
ncbi:rhodanese-like domain-containing protein [Dokdonia ponticola]|uniref:Rhodanese-like domain-containing protein n=1 Tax=Dokdonia ponticola TaxID=2041041 RepID=A0ABV9HXR5_9FLAO